MLTIKWLGVAGLEFQYQAETLLVDPYFSRPTKLQTLFKPLVSDEKKIDEYLGSLDSKIAGILVGHTHSDHVLDVPYIIKKTGTLSYGSESLFTLLSAYDLQQNAMVISKGKTYDIGPFNVSPIMSIHGHALFGLIPFPGEIKKGLTPPLRVNKYRHGGPVAWKINVAGKSFLHLGSADFIDENLKDEKVDVLFVCAAGRQYTKDFSPRLFSLIDPDVIVPFHFDDFSAPISQGEVFPHVPGVNMEGFVEELRRNAPGARIVVPEPFENLEL